MDTTRTPIYPISPILLNRRSLRAMNGKPIEAEQLFSLFEAARWAPSSYNNQPWRFIYGKKGTKHFDTLFSLLVEANQSWCKNAAVLVCVLSKTTFDHNRKPSITHSFDAGSAFENLCLEGCSQNLVVHGMQGFNYELAKSALQVPDDHQVEAMIAIGNPAPRESLSPELLEKEVPTHRRPLEEIVFEGVYQKKTSK